MQPASVSLDDKYTTTKGRVFITGTQAIVRLLAVQRERDRRNGLRTAGYVTGYRGSPLGTLDEQLRKAGKLLGEHDVVFVPGVNEDLAATAVWGSQQAEIGGDGAYDGVYALWYGKGPGVDRTGDAFRHGNLAGSSRNGGVLVLMGDDHTCESSTTCHQSEFAMLDAMIPVLSPSGVQEILDFGVHGWAMSRFSGCWVALKCVKDNVESTVSIDVDGNRIQVAIPEGLDLPAGGLNIRQPDTPHAQEERLHRHKLRAVRAYARSNGLDRIVLAGVEARLGVITHGKSYLDVLQALEVLGLTEQGAGERGLRIYKVGMTWPLEPEGARAFAAGLSTVLVVEEKRSLVEWQLKDLLYGEPAAPRIIGKTDEQGATLFQSELALDVNQVAIALGQRLAALNADSELQERVDELRRIAGAAQMPDVLGRSFYFCSGCPHNSSTVLPEGSKGYAGIGCSWMAQAMDRATTGYTQMGAEGMSWVGEAPFSRRKHMFQNIGDGTYFHSGLLAIRAAVAAGTNITYKILFNDAVAMTGGQKHDGPLDPPRIAHQVAAEGVARIAVVTDEPAKYPAGTAWPPGVTVHHRSALDAVQRELRDVQGTTVLIYDQTCAAEKRRRRKRGVLADPPRRVLINDLVCEGCGDCGRKSNCVSIQPLETEFGRKRVIDQSSCNKDYSCIEGFCPSFVTVSGGKLRARPAADIAALAMLPEPQLPSVDERVYSVLLAGMGGTGVTTIAAILGMAAHLEGKGCGVLDMAGLAQKGGSVWSHLRFGATPQAIKSIRIAAGGADLVLGCDLLVAGSAKTLATARRGRTRMVVNTHESMPGEFTRKPDLLFPSRPLLDKIRREIGEDNLHALDAATCASALVGDALAANMLQLGFAYQLGLIPVHSRSITAAIELNGAGVRMNIDAFRWGRLAAADPAAARQALVERLQDSSLQVGPRPVESLHEAIETRVKFLQDYQDAAYARRYRALVDEVQQAETAVHPGATLLTAAVARFYFKLLAIKDEYEVARLQTGTGFLEAVRRQFDGDYRLGFHFAPPLLARKDPRTGVPSKREYGPWMLPVLRVLAHMRVLRGTPFDVFGYTRERRHDRKLLAEYERDLRVAIGVMAGRPGTKTHELVVRLASLPDRIRGYGHVRAKTIEDAERAKADILAQLDSAEPPVEAFQAAAPASPAAALESAP